MSDVTSYTTSDLSRKSGDIIAEALRHPVTITQRNKPRLVLLSIEDYRRLTGAETRRHYTLDTLPPEILEKAETELERMERERRE